MVLSAIVVKQKGDKGLEKLRSKLAPPGSEYYFENQL